AITRTSGGHRHAISRQVECERASLARSAFKLNRSSEQLRKPATDRKTQAGSAVFTAGRSFRLLERFEYYQLFLLWDTDPGIADCESDNPLGRIERGSGFPSTLSFEDPQTYATFFSELKCVRQQVFQDLIKPLNIGVHSCRQSVR